MKVSPKKWIIHFEHLDDEQKSKIFDELKQFMENEISKFPKHDISQRFMISQI